MSRKLLVALLVVALGLTTVVAWGQVYSPTLSLGVTSRYSGMGEAGLALANDAGALDLNPAGLAMQNTPGAMGASAWGCPPPAGGPGMRGRGYNQRGTVGQVEFGDELSSNLHGYDFHYAGSSTNSPLGWGAAFRHNSFEGNSLDNWSVGGAYRLASNRLSVGVAYSRLDFSYAAPVYNAYAVTPGTAQASSSETHDLFNGGLLYLQPVSWTRVPMRWGLVMDAANGLEPLYSVGVAVPFSARGGLAVDWVDCFHSALSFANVGAEYWLGKNYNWAVRAGIEGVGASASSSSSVGLDAADSVSPALGLRQTSSGLGERWTLGTSYRLRAWQFDLAWAQPKSPFDSSLKLAASLGF